MTQTIYLRADGGPRTGWGHVNRLCSLALILKEENVQMVAVTTRDGAEVFRKNLGQEVPMEILSDAQAGYCLEEWKSLPAEKTILVLDGYHFDYNYQQEAQNMGFRVVLIDDFARGPFAADMLINHAPDSRRLYHQEGIHYCCGMDYALLRPGFYSRSEPAERNQNGILLTLGGADPLGLSARILKQLLPQFPELQWNVVTTDSFEATHRHELEALAFAHASVQLRHNLTAEEMRQLMTQSSYALVSASTVVLEAWSCSLFPAALCYTDNQKIMFQGVCSEDLAFPIELENLEASFGSYLRKERRTAVERKGWNPPLAIRRAFQQIMCA